MKSIVEFINESLFDIDSNIKSGVTSLLNLFGKNITDFYFDNTYNGLGWTRRFDTSNIGKIWKDNKNPIINFPVSKYAPLPLQKLAAVILNKIVINNPKKFIENILSSNNTGDMPEKYHYVDIDDNTMSDIRDYLWNNNVIFHFWRNNTDSEDESNKTIWMTGIRIRHYDNDPDNKFEIQININTEYAYKAGINIKITSEL